MSRLSKTEIYAALWLSHTGMEVPAISKELKLSEKSIVSILEKQNTTNENNTIKTGSEPTKKNKSNKSLMINETASKKSKSVSIMTEAASQRNDETIKNAVSKRNNDKDIFRPNNG